jgi:hypothetical protein
MKKLSLVLIMSLCVGSLSIHAMESMWHYKDMIFKGHPAEFDESPYTAIYVDNSQARNLVNSGDAEKAHNSNLAAGSTCRLISYRAITISAFVASLIGIAAASGNSDDILGNMQNASMALMCAGSVSAMLWDAYVEWVAD